MICNWEICWCLDMKEIWNLRFLYLIQVIVIENMQSICRKKKRALMLKKLQRKWNSKKLLFTPLGLNLILSALPDHIAFLVASCMNRIICANCYKPFQRLPKRFAMANGLFNKKRDLIIRDERQRLWNLRLAPYGSSVHVLGGWIRFCTANSLQEGDYMMFEVVSNGEKPIWKFHSITDRRHKTSDVATPISQAPASTSADANPYFISTIKRYTFTKAIFYLPMDFVKSNGLKRRRKMILVDEMQRSWSVCLGQMERHFGIKSGWPQFRKANNVQGGDTYKFELTNNGKIPIVHVNVLGIEGCQA